MTIMGLIFLLREFRETKHMKGGRMTYPKAVMTKKELMEMGWLEEDLMTIFRRRDDIAWKAGSGGKTSPICFDTEKLEKYRKARCKDV